MIYKILKIISLSTILTILFVSCTASRSSTISQDNTIGNSKSIIKYSGAKYNIGILDFDNLTKVRGFKGKAINILRTLISNSGLTPIILTDKELRLQDKLIKMQLNQNITSNKKEYSKGYNEIDYRISGSITSYVEVEEGSNYGLGRSKESIAKITVDYSLIDPVTGQVFISKSGNAEYKKSTSKFLGMGGSSSIDLGLREGALRAALSKATSDIIQELNKIPYKSRVVNAEDKSRTIVVKVGRNSNIRIGTLFNVYRLGKAIIDRTSGEKLGHRRKLIGTARILEHINNKLSLAKVKGKRKVKENDIIEIASKK